MNVQQQNPNGPRRKVKKLILTTREKLKLTRGYVDKSLDKMFGIIHHEPYVFSLRGSRK